MKNKCKFEVTKARSYQTLINKTGRFTYPSKHYKPYKEEMAIGMKDLKPIVGNVPIRCRLVFNGKGGAKKEHWNVSMKETGNTSKNCKTEKEALKYYDKEKHTITYVPCDIKYGSLADTDNIQKPVVDYLEELGIIENDRLIVDIQVIKTFGNKKETIEIELEELKPVNGTNISFKEVKWVKQID